MKDHVQVTNRAHGRILILELVIELIHDVSIFNLLLESASSDGVEQTILYDTTTTSIN